MKYNNLQRKITGTLDTRAHSCNADGNEYHGSDFGKLDSFLQEGLPDRKAKH